MRLFYVALTRAESSLYLISSFKEKVKPEEEIKSFKWNDFISLNFRYKIIFKENILDPLNHSDLLLRKIYRDKNIYNDDSLLPCVPRKLFITQIKDFVFCPQLFLRNLIYDEYKTTIKENSFGALIHKKLENYVNQSSEQNDDYNLANFVNSDLGKQIFSAINYDVEFDFLYEFEGSYFRGRIDRINIYEDSVWLMDYKTIVDESNKRLFNSYIAQLVFYSYFVRSKFPEKNLKVSIIDVTNIKEYVICEKEIIFMRKTLSELFAFLKQDTYDILFKDCKDCIIKDGCKAYKI